MSSKGLDAPLHLAAAAFAWTVLDGVVAGYAGAWFAPTLLVLGVHAAFAILLAATGLLVLRRLPGEAPFTEAAAHAVIGAIVAGGFLAEWVDGFSSLAIYLPGSKAMVPVLALLGGFVGALAGLLPLRLGPALQWAAMGLLVAGPRCSAAFDHVSTGRRALGLVVTLAGFAAVYGVISALERRLGRRRLAVAAAALPLVVLLVAVALPGPPEAAPGRPSIVVVLIDTLRADRLLAPEGETTRMPHLAALARDGVLFEQAIAPSPWTLPSSVSVLSGWNPHRHLAGRSVGAVALPGRPEAFFLGRALRERGYTVGAFVNNPYLRPYYGFGRDHLRFRRYRGRAADGVGLASDWLHAQRGPHFLLLHLMDPHWPYEAPTGFGAGLGPCERCDSLRAVQYGRTDTGTRAELERRYDAEVAYTDAAIARFVEELRAAGSLEHTWLVVTADHGEEFWEHEGFLHGHSLYDEQLRVPLVIVPPAGDVAWAGARGRRVHAQVRLEDVGATILELAGVPTVPAGEFSPLETDAGGEGGVSRNIAALAARPEIDGRSLIAEMHGGGGVTAGTVRTAVAGFLKSPTELRYALRIPQAKFISSDATGAGGMFFDLLRDPAETRNLAHIFAGAETNARARKATGLLHLGLAKSGLHPGDRRPVGGNAPATAADTEAELRALGYLD